MQHYNSRGDIPASAGAGELPPSTTMSSTSSSSLSSSTQSSSNPTTTHAPPPVQNLALMRGLFEELAQFNQRIAALLAQHDGAGLSNLFQSQQPQQQQQQQLQQSPPIPRNESAQHSSAAQPTHEADPRKRTHTQFAAATSHSGLPVTLPVGSSSTHPSTAPNPAPVPTTNSSAFNTGDQAALILFDASIRPVLVRSRPQLSYSVASQMIKDQWVHLSDKEKDVYRAKARLVLQQEEEKEAEKKRLKEEKKRLTKKMKTAMTSSALAQSLSAAALAPPAAVVPAAPSYRLPTYQSSPSSMQPSVSGMNMNQANAGVTHSSSTATTAARVSPARPPHPRSRGHLHVSVSDGSSNTIIQVLDTFAPRGISSDNADNPGDESGSGNRNQVQAPLTSPSSAGSGDSPPDPSARSITIQPMPISSFNTVHNSSLLLPANASSAATGGMTASSSSFLAASPMMLLPSPNSAAPSPATVVPSTLTHAALPLISSSNSSPPRSSGPILRPKAVHLNASPPSQPRSLSPKKGERTTAAQQRQQQLQQRPYSMENEHSIHAQLRAYVQPPPRGYSPVSGDNERQLNTKAATATVTNMQELNSSPSPLPAPNDSPATSPIAAMVPATQQQNDEPLLGISPRTSPTFIRASSMPSTSAETASIPVHHALRTSDSMQLQSEYDLIQHDEDDAADPAPVRMMDTSPMSPVQEGPE